MEREVIIPASYLNTTIIIGNQENEKKYCTSTNEIEVTMKNVAKTILVIAFIRAYERSLEFAQIIPLTEKSIRFREEIPQSGDDMSL
jgi:hypothetical protein